MSVSLTAADWLSIFLNFMGLSLLAVGGGLTVAPAMHRYLVLQNGFLTDTQFTSSMALAQVAPGPNMLFVALMGWNVGMNAGGMCWALLGALLCMLAIVLPSSILTLLATRWAQKNQNRREVRAFKQGMAPLVVALVLSTAWVLISAIASNSAGWSLLGFGVAALFVLWKTKIHLLWVLASGALLGAMGWV
jgi:chromate transporter